ncbi:hypothetical protein A4R69_00780 [Corynebacterium pseudotuberculosis]|nr:hypothetical protein A4R69_00780 [Corynebacterium pseudotuberculosis]
MPWKRINNEDMWRLNDQADIKTDNALISQKLAIIKNASNKAETKSPGIPVRIRRGEARNRRSPERTRRRHQSLCPHNRTRKGKRNEQLLT